jgi:ornithine cyclodeaminase/alanine dehydrogenase-like protein (mu-crystallin family)
VSRPVIIGPDEVRQLVRLDDLIDPVAEAFRAASRGWTQDEIVTMYPARTMEEGDVFVKTSCRPGGDRLVVKVSPWFATNADTGAPQGGFSVLLDATTGHTVALIEDQHHLSDLRTAAATSLIVRLLAPGRAGKLAIVGTGAQAYWQTIAAVRQRPMATVSVWGRSPQRGDALRARLRQDLAGPAVTVDDDLARTVHDADVVITATSARTPIIDASWLRVGQLVISIGSDDATKAELHPECLATADLVVVDRRDTARRLGNVHRAISEGVLDPDPPLVELGELLDQHRLPRPTEALAVATLVGIGAQDLAAASVVADRWNAAHQPGPAQ